MPEDLNQLREEKCIPVAKEILNLIANGDVRLGTEAQKDFEGTAKIYAPIKEKVGQLFLDKDLKLSDVTFTFALARQAMDLLEQKVNDMLNDALRRAEAKLWGCTEKEISMKKLDEVAKQ